MVSIFYKKDKTYILEPLTDKMVHTAENLLKVKLPEDYINILKEQNGGNLKYNSYPINQPEGSLWNQVKIDHLMGISNANDEGILLTSYLIKEWKLPNDLVLLSGDGHTWIALDYRKTNQNPPIIFIDTETEEIIQLASNFSEFIAGLITTKRVQKKNKKIVFADIEMNLKVSEKNVETSSLFIKFKDQEENSYSFHEKIFETFHPDYDLKKSFFIRQLEDLEEELKDDEFGNSHYIGINGHEDDLIFKYDRKKDQVIVKENRKTLGYFSNLNLFLELFYKNFNLILNEIQDTNLSKDFET